MMKHYNFRFLLMCFIVISVEGSKTEDYCWREYEGTLPSDALRVNQENTNGRPVYIGQALFREKLIPGKIYDNDTKIYFEYFDVEYSSDANVKIFCTTKPGKFEWIPVRNTDILHMPSNILITGGFEPKCTSYIGRVDINGEMIPGKVVCCKGAADCYGLYTTNNSKGSLHTNFQILRYDEHGVDANTGQADPSIDVRIKDKQQNTKCKKTVINLFI